MKDTIKFVVTLVIVTVLSAGILSYVYIRVKGKIEIQKKASVENAIKFVFNDMAKKEEVKNNNSHYWKCFDKDNKLLGYAVLCKKGGFSSIIQIIAGVKPDGAITRIKIISQQETPGLGAKMNQIRSNKYIWDFITGKKRVKISPIPYFQKQFFGKNYEDLIVVKHKPNKNNEIQALTGATISSKAVTNGIKKGIAAAFKIIKSNEEVSK